MDAPHQDSIPGSSIEKRVAIPTELYQPTLKLCLLQLGDTCPLLCVFVLQFVNTQFILTSTAVRSIHSELVNQSITSTICLHWMFQLLSTLAASVDVKRLLAATATYVFNTLAEMDISWAGS